MHYDDGQTAVDRINTYAYWLVMTGSEKEAECKAYKKPLSASHRYRLRKSKQVRITVTKWVKILMDGANISRENIVAKVETLIDVCLAKADQATPAELAELLSPLKDLLEMVGGNWARLSNAESIERFSMSMNYQLPQSKLKEIEQPATATEYRVLSE